MLSSRLEVLNLSENRLTDACCSYLATILQNCKCTCLDLSAQSRPFQYPLFSLKPNFHEALYSLNLEQTSITSRTVQKIADALPEESPLSQLFIGTAKSNQLLIFLSQTSSLYRKKQPCFWNFRRQSSDQDLLFKEVREIPFL